MNSSYSRFSKGSNTFFKTFSKSFSNQYNNKFQSNFFNTGINSSLLTGMFTNSLFLQRIKFISTANFIQKSLLAGSPANGLEESDNKGLSNIDSKLSVLVGYELMQLLSALNCSSQCK